MKAQYWKDLCKILGVLNVLWLGLGCFGPLLADDHPVSPRQSVRFVQGFYFTEWTHFVVRNSEDKARVCGVWNQTTRPWERSPYRTSSSVETMSGEQWEANVSEKQILLNHRIGNKHGVATLNGHEASVSCIAFSHDGKKLASGSEDKTIKLWDVRGEKSIATLLGHADTIWCVAFSPEGRLIASGSKDKTIKLWNVATGKMQATLQGLTEPVWWLSFSPDGKNLAAGCGEDPIKLWEISTGRNTATLHAGRVFEWPTLQSPDRRYLMDAGWGGEFKF
jgi:WD40 repeat protein